MYSCGSRDFQRDTRSDLRSDEEHLVVLLGETHTSSRTGISSRRCTPAARCWCSSVCSINPEVPLHLALLRYPCSSRNSLLQILFGLSLFASLLISGNLLELDGKSVRSPEPTIDNTSSACLEPSQGRELLYLIPNLTRLLTFCRHDRTVELSSQESVQKSCLELDSSSCCRCRFSRPFLYNIHVFSGGTVGTDR